MCDSACNGAEAVGVLPSRFRALLEFLNAQHGWPNNDVLAVIEFPVLCEDAPFGFETFVKSGVRKRRDDGEARQVNVRLNGELGGLQKHIRPIVIETKHKAALKCDSVLVQPFDDANKLFRRIETFMALPEVLRGDGFESHQQASAPAAPGEFEQFQIVRQQNGCET